MPISKIKVGDMFTNPLWADGDLVTGNIYVVEEINTKEKLVKVQTYNSRTMKPFMKPFWKRSSDRMFSEDWRLEPVKEE